MLWPVQGNDTAKQQYLSVGHGDIGTLRAAFDQWREIYEKQGGSAEILKLNLGYSKALSQQFVRSRGTLTLNLLNGQLDVRVADLADGEYALWLVDDGKEAGNTVKPEATDNVLHVGNLASQQGQAQLAVRLKPDQLAGFNLDSVVLTRAGQSPVDGVILAGAPDLLEKLYYAQQAWAITPLGALPTPAKPALPFEFLLPKPALADTVSDLTPVLGAQVALGRQIFHNETFGGNGRSCGTCHRADNNFTVDPAYIAKLPVTDPLFVAETNPALANLENPTLLRKYGLILTNVDGPGTDVFRSVPHTLSLATSAVSESTSPTAPFTVGEFTADNAFAAATGWSGDGAPGSGSLREFALGAVVQHMPKTLNRVVGSDFRLPTNAELDAIEAYTLSLGRNKDYPLWQLTFSEPLAQAGKNLFDTKQNPCTHNTAQTGGPSPAAHCPSGETLVQGETANCNGCHQHAGARSSTTFANPTRNTGVENFKIHPARLTKPDLSYDGGFGTNATTCGPNGEACYGDGRFNTPSLIEAADTGPFFHNNSVGSLEDAIAAYNSDAFNQSPGAFTSKLANRQVKLDATQVAAIGSFLRAVNAVENIRLSNRLDSQAKQIANADTARELIKLAYEENQDAISVLKTSSVGILFGGAVKKLEEASRYQSMAQLIPGSSLRNVALQQAITAKKQAKALIISCNPNAARPSTVGASPTGFVYSCTEVNGF